MPPLHNAVRVDDQSTPTTADIQQAFSWAQAQFATNVIELAFLGRVQVIVRCQKYAQE